MKHVRRMGRRFGLAYVLRCAREDARKLNIVTPAGIWVCHHCPHISWNQFAFSTHLSGAHA